MLTDTDRARLRAKQDFLIMLVMDMAGMPEDLRLAEGGPVLADVRRFIYPEWESRIDVLVEHWAGEQRPRVGVPDWDHVTALMLR